MIKPRYMYFKAAGRSLETINTVEAARQSVASSKKSLCDHFGAQGASFFYDELSHSYKVSSFRFKPEDTIPQKWNQHAVTDEVTDEVTHIESAPQSHLEDKRYIENKTDLIQHPLRQSRLENAFNTGEMPKKILLAGFHCRSFVRSYDMQYMPPGKNPNVGQINDNVSHSEYAEMTNTSQPDPLDHIWLEGDAYIRVPIDTATSKACFVPPDSTQTSLDLMLELDRQAYAMQRRHTK